MMQIKPPTSAASQHDPQCSSQQSKALHSHVRQLAKSGACQPVEPNVVSPQCSSPPCNPCNAPSPPTPPTTHLTFQCIETIFLGRYCDKLSARLLYLKRSMKIYDLKEDKNKTHILNIFL